MKLLSVLQNQSFPPGFYYGIGAGLSLLILCIALGWFTKNKNDIEDETTSELSSEGIKIEE